MGPVHESPATEAIGQGSASTSVDAGLVTLWLRGDQDLSTSADLSTVIDGVVARGVGDVVIDLSAVSFMDAGTIGRIVAATNLLAVQSREVVVRRPSAPAQRVLRLCGLLGLIEIRNAGHLTSSDP